MPYHQSSWEVTTMIFNSLDMSNKDNPQAADVRQTFGKFVGNVIEHALGTTLGGERGELEVLDNSTSPPEWKIVPGTFYYPWAMGLTFDVFYCKLAMKMEEEMANDPNLMAYLVELWTNAIISLEDFNMETLMAYFGVEISIEESFSILDTGKCEVNYDVVFDFLAKVYLFDFYKYNRMMFEKFGTTMEQLVDEGKLWIMSNAASENLGWDWVSLSNY